MNEIDRKTSAVRSCPICGQTGEPAFKPFCSKRCADIDLNRWLSGVYAVPAKDEEDEDGGRPPESGADNKCVCEPGSGLISCSRRSSAAACGRSATCPMPAMQGLSTAAAPMPAFKSSF